MKANSGIVVLCDTMQNVRDNAHTHNRREMDETKRYAKILELNSASSDFVVGSNIVTTLQLEHQMNITNKILLFHCWTMS